MKSTGDSTWRAVLEGAVASGAVPGVAAAIVGPEGLRHHAALGHGSVEAGRAVTPDTVFYIASMTKAMTAVAVLQLLERGQLSLDQPVSAFLPSLADPVVLEGFNADGQALLRPARSVPTLRQAVTHTAGYSGGTWNPLIQRYQALHGIPGAVSGRWKAFESPLAFDPGARWEYGWGMDVAGRIVEVVTGMDLEAYFIEHLFGPLEMHDTRYTLSPAQLDRMAHMHVRSPEGFRTLPFKPMGFPEFHPGGGGLASTVGDMAHWIEMVLNQGRWRGRTVLRPDSVAAMGRDLIAPLAVPPARSFDPAVSADIDLLGGQCGGWGLSFLVNRQPLPGARAPGSITWAGLRNTFFWADPARRLGGVMLCQSAPFMDPAVLDTFMRFERAAYGAVPPRTEETTR